MGGVRETEKKRPPPPRAGKNNHYLSVWMHRISSLSFFTTFGCISHIDCGISSFYLTQMFLETIPTTWFWHSLYSLSVFILHPITVCWAVLGPSFHNLYLGPCLTW
ncbi:hypothetical protein XENOCAPTIV_021509 [Xenoophorus captivus]|uniref:Uncharacterized protein n=1 Tax=Xenoophorus captivus TaxID=1517983 RepID=A0ABV0RIG9_9TELE